MPTQTPNNTTATAVPSLEEKAYRYLLGQIRRGELRQGDRISALAVSKTTGISRTPLTHAVRRLEAEGFLTNVPNSGSVVRELTHQELKDTLELRTALEGYAAEVFASSPKKGYLTRLEKTIVRMNRLINRLQKQQRNISDEDLKEHVLADFTFHLIVMRATGNKILFDQFCRMHTLMRSLQYRPVPNRDDLIVRTQESIHHHERILSTFIDGNANKARQNITEHLKPTMEQVLLDFEHYTSHKVDHLTMQRWPASVAEALLDIESSFHF
ncbi:GntR family transcriptional regulator [Poriferisphaera sp. WC338]|uniref:GntR family transcriptional regulator n=1 Tax=Poriferisphaera sp. WC338 TaxID=3425129 RepID=UPI003D81288D